MKKTLSLIVMLFAMVTSAMAQKTITVKNANDFIKAIGPNRTIIIDAKQPLNITDALYSFIMADKISEGDTYYSPGGSEYEIKSEIDEIKMRITDFSSFQYNNTGVTADGIVLPNVTFSSNSDGMGFQIRNCHNLTIRAKKGMVTLLASPRYVNVLEFIECNNLTLDHIVMGHTDEGYCDKGVLELDGCIGVKINDCDLFGCGTEGFQINYCSNVIINRTNTHDCSYYTLHVSNSNQVRFNDCKFYDNREFDQINISDTKNISFNGCSFDNLQGPLFSLNCYCQFVQCIFRNCQMEPITSQYETVNGATLVFSTTMFGDTPLPAAKVAKPKIKAGRWGDGETIYTLTQMDDYCFMLRSDDGKGFNLRCLSADKNEYETSSTIGLENPIGVMGARIESQNGKALIRINDDGGELLKSFFYLGE